MLLREAFIPRYSILGESISVALDRCELIYPRDNVELSRGAGRSKMPLDEMKNTRDSDRNRKHVNVRDRIIFIIIIDLFFIVNVSCYQKITDSSFYIFIFVIK